jgi:serine/threonine-protein phosphatase 2A regulatory subunit B
VLLLFVVCRHLCCSRKDTNHQYLGFIFIALDIVDIKPANMEELIEVITSAEFHPTSCNIFMYSSSKGTVKLGDMRDAALCDQHAKGMRTATTTIDFRVSKFVVSLFVDTVASMLHEFVLVFEEEEDLATKSFFSEITTSISDCKFSGDGRYIVSRDYLTLKIWDLHMESRPVKTIKIHEHLRSKLCDLYENDCIFDKFECHSNFTGRYSITNPNNSPHAHTHTHTHTHTLSLCY